MHRKHEKSTKYARARERFTFEIECVLDVVSLQIDEAIECADCGVPLRIQELTR